MTALDWVNGADLYQAKWKHTPGAKICQAHNHEEDDGDHDHDHDHNHDHNHEEKERLWTVDDDGNHDLRAAQEHGGRPRRRVEGAARCAG